METPLQLMPTLMCEQRLPARRALVGMEVMQQRTDFTCGPACARMLLKYHGRLAGRSERQLAYELGTRFGWPQPGTHPEAMVRFLRAEGFGVEWGEYGELELLYEAIDAGMPALILDSTWGGHWRIVAGYELYPGPDSWVRDTLYVADPEFRIESPAFDPCTQLTMQNARMFYRQWYENRLYARARERFYVIVGA